MDWWAKKVKIGDFGVARKLDPSEKFATTSIGTPFYLSPEICQGLEYDFRSDVWNLGCVLFELFARKKPFEGNYLNVSLKGNNKQHC